MKASTLATGPTLIRKAHKQTPPPSVPTLPTPPLLKETLHTTKPARNGGVRGTSAVKLESRSLFLWLVLEKVQESHFKARISSKLQAFTRIRSYIFVADNCSNNKTITFNQKFFLFFKEPKTD